MDPIVKAGILLILSYENPHNGYSKTKESKFCSGEAIIAATHWNYHNGSIATRMRSNPQITEEYWTSQKNNVLRSNFSIKQVKLTKYRTRFHDVLVDVNASLVTLTISF